METLSGTQQQVVTRLLRHYVSFEFRHLTNCIDKSLVVLCSMDHLVKYHPHQKVIHLCSKEIRFSSHV